MHVSPEMVISHIINQVITKVSQSLAYLNTDQHAALGSSAGSTGTLDRYAAPEEDLLDFDVPFTHNGASGVREVRAHDTSAAMKMVPGSTEAIWRSR